MAPTLLTALLAIGAGAPGATRPASPQAQAERGTAHRYARAIIQESRLRGLADQLARLVVYLQHAGRNAAPAEASLRAVRADAASLEASLQVGSEAPAFARLDYDAIEKRLPGAIVRAAQARDAAADLLAGAKRRTHRDTRAGP